MTRVAGDAKGAFSVPFFPGENSSSVGGSQDFGIDL
jgi:hypothetical protein